MNKKLKSIALIAAAVGVLAGCGEEKSDQLTMVTSADYPPFEYIDTAGGGKYVGIDVEIAQAITEKLGYELEIKDMDFGGLVQSVQSKQADFAMAAMTIDEERAKSVDFSETYYMANHAVISLKDSGISSETDLAGKKVGAQLGTIQEDKLLELEESIGLEAENRNKVPELIQELKSNRLDAIIVEDTVATGFLETNSGLQSFTIEDSEGGYAIAFPKGSKLVEEFNKALNELLADGTIDSIIKKYYE